MSKNQTNNKNEGNKGGKKMYAIRTLAGGVVSFEGNDLRRPREVSMNKRLKCVPLFPLFPEKYRKYYVYVMPTGTYKTEDPVVAGNVAMVVHDSGPEFEGCEPIIVENEGWDRFHWCYYLEEQRQRFAQDNPGKPLPPTIGQKVARSKIREEINKKLFNPVLIPEDLDKINFDKTSLVYLGRKSNYERGTNIR